MAVSAPGDSPPDQGGGFLAWLQGLAPEAQSAIMRVMAQTNPVSSANAATADSVSQAPSPLATPSPVDSRLIGGGPPVPAQLTSNAAQIASSGGSAGGAGASGGGAWPVGPPGSQPAPAAPPVQMGFPFPPGYGPETTHMPYPGQVDPKGVFAPKPAAQPAVARGGSNARAQAPGAAAASNLFTPIVRPNIGQEGGATDQYGRPMTGGVLTRGGGPPLMTALDLSKLFGRS